MITAANAGVVSDRIQEIGRNPRVAEDGVHEIKETVTFIIGIGMNAFVWVASPAQRITIEASLALPVLNDHHFAAEAIRVVKNPLYQASD
jgi:exosome complex RNA-binding protein Rrp4